MSNDDERELEVEESREKTQQTVTAGGARLASHDED